MHSVHRQTQLYIQHNKEIFNAQVKFSNFADGDTHCQISDTQYIPENKILIVHQLYPSQNEWIVRLLFLINTLKTLGAKSVTVFVPYLPYARQDKSHFPGESVSSHILCKLLKQSGCHNLFTIDCHFMKGSSYTEIEGLKIHNILVQDKLLAVLKDAAGDKIDIIGPDNGSAYLAAGRTMNKRRKSRYAVGKEGSIQREVDTIDASHIDVDMKKNSLAIVDDMISTGSTILKALQLLKSKSKQPVHVLTTHGLFLNDSYKEISDLADSVIYSDTIPREKSVPVVENVLSDIKKSIFK